MRESPGPKPRGLFSSPCSIQLSPVDLESNKEPFLIPTQPHGPYGYRLLTQKDPGWWGLVLHLNPAQSQEALSPGHALEYANLPEFSFWIPPPPTPAGTPHQQASKPSGNYLTY